MEEVLAFLKGFGLNAGLIVAIGAQNAFVLAQGLARRFVFLVSLVCSLCDSLLIALGVVFIGAAAAAGHWAVGIFIAAGAAYLLWFGFGAARACIRGDSLHAAAGMPKTARGALLAALALSVLNPHAVLEMTVIFGGVAAKFPVEEKIPFAIGGAVMSFVWFFGLGFGAAKIAPLLNKPIAWRFINGGIALMMFAVAGSLLSGFL